MQMDSKDRRIAALEDACRAAQPSGTPVRVVRSNKHSEREDVILLLISFTKAGCPPISRGSAIVPSNDNRAIALDLYLLTGCQSKHHSSYQGRL